jgi:spectinomycin phosphotransferase
MLEKPGIQDEQIIAYVRDAYGAHIAQIAFLPLGADPNTAVYRAVAADTTAYFVKLRSGAFDEMSVALPKCLYDQGIAQIIPPLTTKTGQLWVNLGAFTVIVYPFVEGRNGFEVAFSDRNWRDFGMALRRLHTAIVPPALTQRIQQETYSAQAREKVKMYLSHIEGSAFADGLAAKLAAFLRAKRAEILDLVGRAERLARALQAQPSALVVCHSDAHAGNILIDADDHLYIVDWDNPILAPKERDLMFVGGGQGFRGHTALEEERLFYQGYEPTQVDPAALAYYRYERIVQDIAAFCEEILMTTVNGEDRAQSLRYLMSNFLPNQTIEIAYTSDRSQLGAG